MLQISSWSSLCMLRSHAMHQAMKVKSMMTRRRWKMRMMVRTNAKMRRRKKMTWVTRSAGALHARATVWGEALCQVAVQMVLGLMQTSSCLC